MSKERLERHTHVAVKVEEYKKLKEQAERVQELEEQLKDRDSAISTGIHVSNLIKKQNKRYREAIESMRSEVKYALYSNKSEDVKRHYLQNAEREADKALEESE